MFILKALFNNKTVHCVPTNLDLLNGEKLLMASESSKLRNYGLEFINDLAKDRKVGVQSVGVAFSTYKTNLKQSNVITRVNDRQFADELLKQFQEEVKKNFESQLTRITIKSLGWIKRVLSQGEKILVTDAGKEEELQQTVTDLTRQMKTKSAELSRTKLKLSDLEEELKGKKIALQELKAVQQQQLNELEQTILLEKKDTEILSNQLEKLEEEVFAYKLELEEKMNENSLLKEKNNQMNLDLVRRNNKIERLTQVLEQARSSVIATDEDVTAAMEQFAVTYQQQEEHFQKTLDETRAQYDQMIKTRVNEISDQYKKEIEAMNEKLSNQESREKKLIDQISELTMNRQNLTNRKGQLETVIDELNQKNDKISKELSKQKEKYEQLHQELEEEKAKEDERLLHLRDIQLAKTQSKAEWLEQCLSYSNFAPLTILLRMGNVMELEALAKSVGMDPLVLENQLQALHKRDLIDIANNGVITANIPSPEE